MILRPLVRAALASAALALGAAEMPKLSAYDRAQGWRLLFDGADTSEWRASSSTATWSSTGSIRSA